MELPNLVWSKTVMVEPRRTVPKTLNDDPRRPNPLSDNVLANTAMSGANAYAGYQGWQNYLNKGSTYVPGQYYGGYSSSPLANYSPGQYTFGSVGWE